jgi:uncharacterized protein (DUF433 family)
VGFVSVAVAPVAPGDAAAAASCPFLFGAASYHHGMAFERITVDPAVMGGAATIRGLRIRVFTVVAMVADGIGVEEILSDLPDLTEDDVREALRYAAELTRERHVVLNAVA